MKHLRLLGRVISLLFVLQACGRTDVFSDAQLVAIDPPEATVEFDRAAQFTAETTPQGLEVEWVVLPEGAGTISETGIYRAPATSDVSEATVRAFLSSNEAIFAEARVTLVEQSTGAPDLFVKAGGDNQTVSVGQPLPEPLRTRVIDADIVGVPGIVVRFGDVEKITNSFGIATWTPTARATTGPQQFEASVEGLGTLTFTAQVVAGPAASLVVTHPEPTGVAGTTMAVPAVVTLTDASGNPVVGHQATAVGPPDARVDAIDAVSNEDGEQRFSLTLAPVAGTQTFTFEAGDLQATLDVETQAAVPALLRVESGDNQTQQAGLALSEPLVVRLTDATGAPATTGTLAWSAPDGGQLLDAQSQPDRNGFAQARFVLPTQSGVVQVKVDAGDLVGSPATFTFVSTPGDATRLEAVSGDGQTTTAGQPFGHAFTVRATDTNMNPVPDVLVYFETVSGGGSVAPTAVQTDQTGIAQATMTAGAAGPQTYRASATGLANSPIELTNTAIAVAPGLRLELTSGNGQIGAAGTDLPQLLGVRVKNNGTPAAGYAVSFGVAQGGGSVRPTVVTTSSDGLAGGVTARLGPTEGTQRFSASVPGAENSPIFFDAQALPKPVAALRIIAGNGQTGQIDTTLTTPFAVQALDANDQPLSGKVVRFEPLDGGSVSPANVATDARGLASVTGTLGPVEGEQRFKANADGASVVFQVTATREASAVRLLLISGNTQSAEVGQALVAPLVVQAVNTAGAAVSDIDVRWSAESPQATVSDAVVKTDAAGLAKVTATLGGTIGNQRFFADVEDASGSPVVFLATARAAPAERLVVVSGDGQSGRPTTNLGNPLVVQATDRLGNGVAGVAVEFRPAAGGGTVSPATATTDANGEASTTATFGSSVGPHTFIADSSGLLPVTFKATATAAEIVRLEVSPPGKQVHVGSSLRYQAMAHYSDGTRRDVTDEATWSVLDSSLVNIGDAVADKGLAWALRAGTTTVKASVGNVHGSTPITVVAADLKSIVIEPFDGRMSLGSSRAFKAFGTFSNNGVSDVSEYAFWVSTKPEVASVDNTSGRKGFVTAVGTGTAVVSVTSQGVSASRTVTVSSAAVVHLEISPSNVTLPAGATKRFQAFATYADAMVEDVTAFADWASSDEGLLKVKNGSSDAGTATLLAPGTPFVSATWGGKTAQRTVQITDATVTGIALEPAELTLSVPDFRRLRPLVTYSDGSILEDPELAAWTSVDAAIADVSNAPGNSGVVTAIAPGNTKISAAVGGRTAEAKVTVDERNYTRLNIRGDLSGNVTCVRGGTLSLRADASYSLTQRVDVTERANWSSSDPTTATVESGVGRGGTVHCLKAGEATITAAWRSATDTIKVTVLGDPPSEISINPNNANVSIGETRRLTAIAQYGRRRVDVTTSVTWTTTDPATATISNVPGNQGAVLGVGAGTTTVKASFNGVVGESSANVSEATLVKIVISPDSPRIDPWEPLQFKATAHYSNGTTADVTSQTRWLTSDPSIAKINEDGRLAINRSQGTCQVSGTYSGKTAHTTLTIRR